MKTLVQHSLLTLGFLLSIGSCSTPRGVEQELQMFAMDCGSIEVEDMDAFSINGAFDGQSYSLVVPCYLIRHPKGDFLWDTGLDQSLIDTPDGLRGGGSHLTVSIKLTDQLQALGLEPDDIEYVSISHSHSDHVGNAGLFTQSTFIVSAAEYAFMFSEDVRNEDESFATYAHVESVHTIQFDNDYDVFGDGRVVIKTMPGHTPGSAVLLLHLENTGAVLLTGDLITHAAGRVIGAIPAFNTDIAQTRDSIAKFEALAVAEGARVIIQHEPADFHALPIFPAPLN